MGGGGGGGGQGYEKCKHLDIIIRCTFFSYNQVQIIETFTPNRVRPFLMPLCTELICYIHLYTSPLFKLKNMVKNFSKSNQRKKVIVILNRDVCYYCYMRMVFTNHNKLKNFSKSESLHIGSNCMIIVDTNRQGILYEFKLNYLIKSYTVNVLFSVSALVTAPYLFVTVMSLVTVHNIHISFIYCTYFY